MSKGVIEADPRTTGTKGDLSRLRTEGRVPAILYGRGTEPMTVSVREKDVRAALRTGVRVLDLKVGGDSIGALLKDVAWDHLGEKLVHVDFQRLVKGDTIDIRVPLVFEGTPAGIKDGGVFNVVHDTIEVSCQPESVPDRLVVDVSALLMGDSVHLRDIKLPEGVEFVGEPGDVVAVVTHSDKEVEAAPTVPEEGGAGPEVIGEAERKAKEEAKAAETSGKKEGK